MGIILLLILGYSDVASIFAADGLLASVPPQPDGCFSLYGPDLVVLH